MKETISKFPFLLAAGIALFGAIIHWVAPFVGVDWYGFLTAPQDVVDSARNGTMLAPVGAAIIGLLMFACAMYAFSGAGLSRRLPLTKTALAVISAICLLRGLLLIPFLIRFPLAVSTFDIVASAVWFVAGAAFAVGTVGNWRRLKSRA
jgi:hypothetical protein